MPNALKGYAETYWNENWKIARVIFVLVAGQRTKFAL